MPLLDFNSSRETASVLRRFAASTPEMATAAGECLETLRKNDVRFSFTSAGLERLSGFLLSTSITSSRGR